MRSQQWIQEKVRREINRVANAKKAQSAKAVEIHFPKSRDYVENKPLAVYLYGKVSKIDINSVITVNGKSFVHTGLHETVRKLIDILPYDDDEEAKR